MKDLGSTLPDSSLRVKALERMTKTVLAANPDISFRINLTRAALQIDVMPDDSKVDQLHAQILSELEAAYHRSAKEGDKDRLRDQECQALQLIEELEMGRLKELENQVQALECKLTEFGKLPDPTRALQRFGETGSRKDALVAVFSQPYLKEVPDEVKLRLAEEIPRTNQADGKKLLKRLPLSRAIRRSLYASQKWVVQMCDGCDVPHDPIRVWGMSQGYQVLQVDVLKKGGKGWDLTKSEGVWSVLLWAAVEGKIACVVRENLLLVQDMFLWSLASVFKGGRIPFVKEFTAGAVRDALGKGFWDTETWRRFEQWSGAKAGLVPVCDDKGKAPGYLSIGTNLEFPEWKVWDASLCKSVGSRWTLEFRSTIKGVLSGFRPPEDLEALDEVITKGLGEVRETSCRAGAVRTADKDLTPEDIDLFGPMTASEKGQDEEAVSGIAQIKYGLVGAFRIPKEVLQKKEQEGCEPARKDQESKPLEVVDELEEYEPSLIEDNLELGYPVMEDIQDLFESSEVGARALAMHVDSEVKLPWSEEKVPDNEDELRDYLKTLMIPPDQVVLRFFIGLKSKTGVEVTSGIQRMVLMIMKDFPVRTLHCDPGTEFTSDELKKWLSAQMIRLQHPLPADKQANGLAERTIGWCKARARTLLSATGISLQFWPLAIRYACETHNRIEKGMPPLPAFGQQVLHKLKRLPTSAKELMRRWVMTRYLAPHLTVPDGHVLLTDQGSLVASKGFRVGLVDPEALEEARPLPLQELEAAEEPAEDQVEEIPGVPLKRVRGKTSIRAVEYGKFQDEDLEVLSQGLFQEENFSQEGFRAVAQKLQQCEIAASGGRKVDFGGRFVFGAYCHGGLRGVTSLTVRRPWTSKYLNMYLKRMCSQEAEARWSSLMLMVASEVEPHKDFRNEWGTRNFVAHVPGTFDLRIALGQEEETTTCSLGERAVSFDPRSVHSVRSNPGWFVAAYTPLGSGRIDQDKQGFLLGLGFDFFGKGLAARVCALSSEAGSSSDGKGEESSRIEHSGVSCDPDLSTDEQPDSVTPLIGWDVNRGDDLPTVFEETDLATYLEERGVASELGRLYDIGVQEAVDLQFIFLEDLVEAGIPVVSARRIMFGVHPEGTVRPDEPNMCALRTGEVRLYDRAQRQIPWVIQNRTLDFSRPPPPVQGIGMNEELEVHPHPGHELFWGPNGPIDPEEQHQGHPEGPTVIKPDLPEESTASRVFPIVVDSATDPPCGSDEVPYSVSFSRFAFNNTSEEMMRLQSIWDAFDEQEVEGPLETQLPQEEPSASSSGFESSAQELGTSSTILEFPGPAEITDLPEESTASRVPNFSCKALDVGGVIEHVESNVPSPQEAGPSGESQEFRLGCLSEMQVRKVDESFYTPNVEALLSELGAPLKVVHNVSPSEVRQCIEKWKQSALTEVTALEEMKAIVRLRGTEAIKESQIQGTQVLPAKTVFTVKPGSGTDYYRRKCRVVGCGNFEEKGSGLDLYAGGIPADALRATLIEASSRRYSAFVTDVSNAFLLAPIPEGDKNRILLRPPRILEQMQITTEGELWRIERAVYGLRQSPKWWGDFRDSKLRTSSWIGDKGRTRFVQSAVEGNVWKITTESGEVVGFAIIYVDDIMLLSTQSEAEKAYSWIREQWKCTPLQQAEEGQPVTFLGVDVYMGRDDQGNIGFMLCQSGYIQELLRCYSVVPKTRAAPVPKEWFKDMPEAESYTQEELRNAQKITGELLWVTQRSGVDLAYAVALMGSWTVRAPRVVKKIGMRLLEYLGATCDYRLSLIPTADAYEGVTAFSDASFAPYGCNSITGALVTFRNRAVLWKGKRQGERDIYAFAQTLKRTFSTEMKSGSITVAAVTATAGQLNPTSLHRAAKALMVMIILQQVLECESAGDDEEGGEPLNIDLYVLVLLLTFSVLFIWESGKYCLSGMCRRNVDVEPSVRMVNDEDDDSRLRRGRRQEAVRRAIEKESEGLRRRL
ncbi:GIP, partial [Symbiodinium microadriaticum]